MKKGNVEKEWSVSPHCTKTSLHCESLLKQHHLMRLEYSLGFVLRQMSKCWVIVAEVRKAYVIMCL